MNKKIILPLVLTAILMIGGVSAVLVTYLSNTIFSEVAVESPILMDDEVFELDLSIAGSDDFSLVKITNQAEVDVKGDVVITVSPDAQGIEVALTEDINYCFAGLGNMTGVTDCETDYMVWMSNNIDWNDWYANDVYSDDKYPNSLVVNTDGNSFVNLGYTGNDLVLPGLTIEKEATIYGVVYVSTNPALAPGNYSVGIKMTPVMS